MSALRQLTLQTFGALFQAAEKVSRQGDRLFAVQEAVSLSPRIDMAYPVLRFLMELDGEGRYAPEDIKDALEVAANLLGSCAEQLGIANNAHRGDRLLLGLHQSARRQMREAEQALEQHGRKGQRTRPACP